MYIKRCNYLYWKIGRKTYTLRNKCLNSREYMSTYYSYFYGVTERFNIENINYMEKFFLYFPIYNKKYDGLKWEHFVLLINISNSKNRYFYFNILLFCNSTVDELRYLINNSYHNII